MYGEVHSKHKNERFIGLIKLLLYMIKQVYVKFLQEIELLGTLTNQAIVRAGSLTRKVRAEFDASEKTINDNCLNDVPNLEPSLRHLDKILTWRKFKGRCCYTKKI